MNADTPRDRRAQGAQLLRTTDYARWLIRRAQLALAVLAVPVSLTVGIVVAGTGPQSTIIVSATGPTAAGPGIAVEEMSLADSPPAGPTGATRTATDERAVQGLAACLITLAICWLILGAAGLMWRRRLTERDQRDWADGWARVEPLWSDRPL